MQPAHVGVASTQAQQQHDSHDRDTGRARAASVPAFAEASPRRPTAPLMAPATFHQGCMCAHYHLPKLFGPAFLVHSFPAQGLVAVR